VMALVEASTPTSAAGGAPRSGASGLGASRFGVASRSPASVATPAADGYGSDGSDAGRSTYSAAPSQRGDGDSDEDESGGDAARAGYRARRRERRGASYVRDDDIDLDDVL
jgi:hypothetical protein